MTRLFVDNFEVSAPFDMASLHELLKHVEAVHLSPETVVRQIRINGLPLAVPAAEEKSELLFHLENHDTVEIFTGTINQIAQDSVADALQYLDRVEAATPSLITSFQMNPGPESFERLKQLYQGLYWLTILLAKLKTKFQMNLDEVFIQGALVLEHQQKFISVLKTLIEAQEKRDFVLISDLLEYEILPIVAVWREMFGIVSEKVNAAQ
jgi:hypothetical protein